MMTTDLIRTVDGIELPVPGCWAIGGGHPVAQHDAGGWRRRRRRHRLGRTRNGVLTVDADPQACRLELHGETVGPDAVIERWRLDCRLITADNFGEWRFVGTCRQEADVSDAVVVARYHGVYRHGGRATAWLSLEAVVEHPSATPQRRRAFTLYGDVGAAIVTLGVRSASG